MIKLPFCAQVGALNGLVIGFLFGTWQYQKCCGALSTSELAWMILLVAGIALLVSLFVLCVLRRYTFASVFIGTLINAVLVAVVVVLTLNAIAPSPSSILLGVVIGFLMGLIVGWLLCFLCGQRFTPSGTRG